VIRGFAVLALVGCAAHAPPPAAPRATGQLAFVDVAVVSPIDARVTPHQTVVIDGERVVAVGRVAPPAGATVVRASGQFLVPGFADMHVHLPDSEAEIERVLDLSLACGVTTIRGMQGMPIHLTARDRLRAEHRVAPELVLAGPPITTAITPDQARALVRDQKQAGYDLIKVIGGIELPAYQALVEAAAAAHIPVVGHVPKTVGIDAALAAHQKSIEHLQGYRDAAAAPAPALAELATRTRDAGVWNCPTLDFYTVALGSDRTTLAQREGIAAFASDDELAAWNKALADAPPPPDGDARIAQLAAIARELDARGAPLLVGSDTPDTFQLPGFGYVEELRAMARAGLSPAAVLRAATSSADAFFGRPHDGTIAPGARADLVVLDRDPLASVENLAHPAGVVVRGHYLPRAELARIRDAHKVR